MTSWIERLERPGSVGEKIRMPAYTEPMGLGGSNRLPLLEQWSF